MKALTGAGLDWRFICAISDLGAQCATLEADLAVAPLLSQTVPEGLAVLDADSGLPALPVFHINMYLPPANSSKIAAELARHIRKSFALRYPQAA